jgi:hypothetical protein
MPRALGGARAASDVAPWIERLARMGFVAKALLYGTIGGLAALAAFRGRGSASTDTRGALSSLLDAPLGSALVGAMAIGLLGYAVWRVVEGLLDPEHRGSDAKAIAVRASFVARGLAHAALGVSALRMLFGGDRSGGAGGEETGREATRTAFELPGGEWIVMAAAMGIAGYGIYQLYRAAAAKLSRQLNVAEMSREAGRWVIGASRFGIAARGIIFIAVGWTVFDAARRHDASEAGGLREALEVIRNVGRWPFVAVALGLVAYGVYQLLNARYRRVRVSE